jgi:hypothetical protein
MRTGELGRWGEIAVCEQLARNGWTGCTHLPVGARCWGIEAFKDQKKYLFAVKTNEAMKRAWPCAKR